MKKISRTTPTSGPPIPDLCAHLAYDPATGLFRWKHPTANRVRKGDIAGSVTANGYVALSLLGYKMLAHRAAWAVVHGYWPACEVDHINRNRADNRIANLRLVSRSQNAMNAPARPSSQTGILGVGKKGRRYLARVCVNSKSAIIGRFDTPQEAQQCYQAAVNRIMAETPQAHPASIPSRKSSYARPPRPSLQAFRGRFYCRKGSLWCRIRGTVAGTRTETGHIVVCLNGYRTPAHHVVWALNTGKWPPKSKVIDHINGNPCDNRIENLRLATRAQNRHNARSSRKNPFGLRGVVFERGRSRPYAAKAFFRGKLVRIGNFTTPEDAKAAYDAYVKNIRGVFARTVD